MTRDPITLQASLLRIWLAKLGAARADSIEPDDLVDHLDEWIEKLRIRRENSTLDELDRLCRPPDHALAEGIQETTISAFPGCYAIWRDRGDERGWYKVPIVAWAVEKLSGDEYFSIPICVHGKEGDPCDAILMPDGVVSTADASIIFDSIDQWLAWVESG